MIDFVITWVNGDDPIWRTKFDQYSELSNGDKREIRFRDWGLLRYWFRGVEAFTPWVRYVFFVTEGHIPDWLDTNAPKLKIVRHSDFIPKENLPLFNSRAIEVNLHRIQGLSETFVYFNDDFFIIDKLKSSFFFKKGVPCDIAVLNAIDGGGVSDAIIEELQILNRYYKKDNVIFKNIFKWFSYKYGFFVFRTLLLLPWPHFTGFYDPHLPTPFLKSTFYHVWGKAPKKLMKTSKSKFRTWGTVNPYIFRYWQLVNGDFIPMNPSKKASYIQLKDDNVGKVSRFIIKQKKSILVLNDSEDINNFDLYKFELKKAFLKILPDKSSYEL